MKWTPGPGLFGSRSGLTYFFLKTSSWRPLNVFEVFPTTRSTRRQSYRQTFERVANLPSSSAPKLCCNPATRKKQFLDIQKWVRLKMAAHHPQAHPNFAVFLCYETIMLGQVTYARCRCKMRALSQIYFFRLVQGHQQF